ncbi:MAG: apolipoprotein N-acyltransferase [Verrucomicrobia bacterium]|nr:MAG: apolipoprotein N-acyltransferase [Verrucomicrobiota bacterium]
MQSVVHLPDPDLPPGDDDLGASPWLRRHAQPLAATFVFAATLLGVIGMMPPSRYPELAYVFAAPAVFWAYYAPQWRLFLGITLGAQVIAWTFILGWLSHVTWAGLALLGPLIGAWVGAWFVAVRWTVPRLIGRPWAHRVLGVLALGAVWVVLEWSRTWLLSGFPWLPLSATQWQRLSVLQPAAYTGAWGVSFILVVVNVAFAAYAHKLLASGGLDRARTRCPEFIAAMILLLGCLLLTARETFNRARFHQHWANVGIVQPSIPQTVKWDPVFGEEILRILEAETLTVASARPDLLLWPEATTPLAVLGDEGMRGWTEDLVKRARVPLLLGSVAYQNLDTPDERWINGAFFVTPGVGLAPEFYAKRQLVPFGEYVPFRPVLGWLEKFVPIGGDFDPGRDAGVLRLPVGGAVEGTQVGALICFEDIFPSLARASVLAGAEVLIVHTNNGWFGEGAAAYQHAAHAVLRAVETRRPVLRAGNSGWSGWIDECGAIRAVLTMLPETKEVRTLAAERGEAPGTVYFRGGAGLQVTRDQRYVGAQSLYVRWGDWFVGLCLVLALVGWARLRRPYVPPAEPLKGFALKKPLPPL